MKEKWYHKAIKELEKKYQSAKPHDMKDFDGLIEVKGYCDVCKQKKIVIYDRVSKKSFCIDCVDIGTQYYPFEMNEMWEVAHQLLYYFSQLANESDENIIRFSCGNYHPISSIQPAQCYNCLYRNGYPFNLGGDKNCKNYKKKDA